MVVVVTVKAKAKAKMKMNDPKEVVMAELADGVLRQVEQVVAESLPARSVLLTEVKVLAETVRLALQALCTGRTKGMSF